MSVAVDYDKLRFAITQHCIQATLLFLNPNKRKVLLFGSNTIIRNSNLEALKVSVDRIQLSTTIHSTMQDLRSFDLIMNNFFRYSDHVAAPDIILLAKMSKGKKQ